MELAVGLRRIDVPPEDVKELVVRDLRRIVCDLDRLAMLRFMRGDFLVGRVFGAAAGVPHNSFDYAFRVIERRLHAPETAAGKDRCFRRSLRDYLRVTKKTSKRDSSGGEKFVHGDGTQLLDARQWK